MLRRADETYRNHRVAAAPGTHQKIADMVTRHVPTDGKILDLGAYTGALIARLKDAGYNNVYGADLSNHLRESVGDFWACDFNAEFANSIPEREFDCITASEVIEHLDDPRAFLRQCRLLLKPGGVLIISTPNIQFFEGRIKFALTGQLWGFGARNYRSQRHISPISASHLPMMMQESGLHCLEVTTAASFVTPLRKALTAPIWAPMRLAFGPMTLGETLLRLARVQEEGAVSAHGQTPWRGTAETV